MRIMYLANIRLPTDMAHGVQIMKMCEAFAKAGHEVELVVPDRFSSIQEDPFEYYAVKRNFTITRLSMSDTVRFGPAGFYLQSMLFAFFSARYALNAAAPDIVYMREAMPLAFLGRLRERSMLEVHAGTKSGILRALSRRAKLVVAITEGAKVYWMQRGIPAERIIVAPDAVGLEEFAHPESKQKARARLGLPQDEKIAFYIGKFDGWKGTDTLFESSKLLPDAIRIAAIGGEDYDLPDLKKRYPRVYFLGYRPYRELPNNQAAADLLILPSSAKHSISARYTSPLKLFSYMASGIPILAADVPSLREILSKKTAFWFRPDDPKDLARMIVEALKQQEVGREKAEIARREVSRYTWDERAKNILAAAKHVTIDGNYS